MPKKLKGRTLWDFSTSILLQNCKKMNGGPFGLVRYCMLRGKPFWITSLGQEGTIWRLQNFEELVVELRTILVTSGVSEKNTDENP